MNKNRRRARGKLLKKFGKKRADELLSRIKEATLKKGG
jgi:hypothetical protein